jgi:hypothetical protein
LIKAREIMIATPISQISGFEKLLSASLMASTGLSLVTPCHDVVDGGATSPRHASADHRITAVSAYGHGSGVPWAERVVAG